MTPIALVVDDEPHIRRILQLRLGRHGFEVREAEDGEHAWSELEALAGSEAPCAVVLDVMMPKLDGLTLLRRIRDDARLKEIPVVVLTAVRDAEAIATAEALGVEAVVHKPFATERILELLRRATGQQGGDDGATPR